MAQVTLGDVFAMDREAAYSVVQSYMDRDPVTITPFFESGLITSNPIIAEVAASNTHIVELPYWNDFDFEIEPNYSNDVYEDVAVPLGMDTGHMRARNCFLNEAWSSMDLVTDLTGQDPLQRIAGRLDRYWRKEVELRVVATLRGLLEENIEGSGDMVHEAEIGLEGLIDAQLTMGDAFGDIGGYVMNTAAFATFVKEDITETRRNRETNLLERTLNGLPVIVNDTGMTRNGDPVVALIGPGAFGYGMGTPKVPLEYEREAARGNGGGVESLWSRRNIIVHPLGYDFTSESITGNGTETVARGAGWADLANDENWARKASRKQVPIAFLVAPGEEAGG